MPSKIFLNSSLALWRRRESYRRHRVIAYAKRAEREKRLHGRVSAASDHALVFWRTRLAFSRRMIVKRNAQLASLRRPPLRLRALAEGLKLLGLREQGANNRGPDLDKLIREAGGTPGEAWCGDFNIVAYTRAGSKRVLRRWAGVRLVRGSLGIREVRNPLPGDIVTYKFDHEGMFVKWIDRAAGSFEALEGNTGDSGAVSDSVGGGDGVKLKVRSLSQVDGFFHVMG